jgi:amino acid adenylation domain-containing protein
MSIRLLLNQLKESDIRLEITGGKLKINAPQGKLTAALVEKLKNRKQEIIDFLQKNVQRQEEYASIEPAEKKEYYAPSSSQKRMYFLQQLDLESTVYNMLSVIPIPVHIDLEKLETTFKKLIRRHETLRTSFAMVQDKLVQQIHREVDFKIHRYNRMDDFVRSFDLTQAPLLRAGVIGTGTGGRHLAIEMHHIISDGISIGIMTGDFMALDRGEHLPPMRLQYRDYAQWHNRTVRREACKKQEAYWLTLFSGEIPVLDLPTDYPRPSFQSFEGSSVLFEIPVKETALLKEMALKKEFTLYMILLSLLTILMSKLSGQEDIVIGTPIAGRGHADLESIIGMFVNTLALRNFPSGEKTIESFLHEVKQRILEAFENQDYQFEDLVEEVVSNRDVARNPLFDVMFALQDLEEYPGNKSAFADDTVGKTGTGDYKNPVSKFDMSWTAMEIGNCLVFRIEYCTKLFKEETILKFIEFFKKIVTSSIENSGRKISQIKIITEEEKKRVLYDFNDSEKTYPKEKTIHRLFEEQAAETPDNIAVIAPSVEADSQLSYRELNEKSGRLAAGTIVGIKTERSVEMIIGMIGILKAGGAYLPIDPDYPKERVDFMLKDSGVNILVTAGIILAASQNPFFHPFTFLFSKPYNLAYVLYTSGTTGKPKGVMVEHRNVVNVITWFGAAYGFKPGVHVLQMSNYTFDASVNQVFGTLSHGAGLYLIPKNMLMDVYALRRFIQSHRIHVINFVPSLIYELLCGHGGERLDSLQVVISGAEKLDDVVKRRILELGYRLYNQYGPTETTIDALVAECTMQKKVNLGTPPANVKCYICDRYNTLLPIGIVGELIVSGAGVARGYLNRPELTAEKFTRNAAPLTPLPLYPSTPVYRTGDLCRWLPDGNIEFLGRMDNQVKIRGFRIELEEIESQLLNYKEIRDAVVVAHEQERGNKFLCAYIVSEKKLTTSLLREYLTGKLPDYMIPTHFIHLEKIPLTANGKINRKALPEPGIEAGDEYVPPQNETEEKLVEIWAEVLEVEKTEIGIDHNFFELGGNSVKLIILVGKINKEFKINVPIIAQIYNNPRIRDMANFMTKSNLSEQPVILLNWVRPKKMFGVPDQFGYGFGYMSLAFALEDYSFYLLSFIEDDNRLSRYVDIIKGIQPTGPYIFFGHSAGGLLAYELALTLEKQGCEVSDLIFGECFLYDNARPMPDEEYIGRIRPIMEAYLKDLNAEFLMEKVIEKTLKYKEYRMGVTRVEKINANIHLILAEDTLQSTDVDIDPHCWDKLTTKPSRIYNGWGDHRHMLMGRALEKNGEIIKKILGDVEFGK